MWLSKLLFNRRSKRSKGSAALEIFNDLPKVELHASKKSASTEITTKNINPFFTALFLLQTPPIIESELISRFTEEARASLSSNPKNILRISQIEKAFLDYLTVRDEVKLVEASLIRSRGEDFLKTEEGTLVVIRDTIGSAANFLSIYESLTINTTRLLYLLSHMTRGESPEVKEEAREISQFAIKLLRDWRSWRESIVNEADRIFGNGDGSWPLSRCFKTPLRQSQAKYEENGSIAA